MNKCYVCKNRYTYVCRDCLEWNRYESVILINPVLAKDISKEMKMLADRTVKNVFGDKKERKNDMKIKKVYFNEPVTVVLWEDGTKTIVKSGEEDIYDPEKGLAMAIAKKALGNRGNYYEVFKKWLPEEKDEKEYIDNIKQVFNNVRPVTMLTPEELAKKLGCSKATIQKQCRDGLHPGAEKVGGKWKIPY